MLHGVSRMTFTIAFYLGPVISCCQEPLSEPREIIKLDTTCGDAELFQRFFLPNGEAAVCFLGDMWEDVTCLQEIYIYIYTMCLCVSFIQISICSAGYMFHAQAKLSSALKYLGSCKHFAPAGRWAMASEALT